MSKSIVEEKAFEFSLDIIEVYKIMTDNKEYVLSKQLLRAATSVGANITEATAAVSKKDFAYKMSIASKEARETRYWLMLIDRSGIVEIEIEKHLKQIDELIKILTSIVKTSQNNLTKN